MPSASCYEVQLKINSKKGACEVHKSRIDRNTAALSAILGKFVGLINLKYDIVPILIIKD